MRSNHLTCWIPCADSPNTALSLLTSLTVGRAPTSVLCDMENFEKIWDLRPAVSSRTESPTSPSQGNTTPAKLPTSSTETNLSDKKQVQLPASTTPGEQLDPAVAAAVAGPSVGTGADDTCLPHARRLRSCLCNHRPPVTSQN